LDVKYILSDFVIEKVMQPTVENPEANSSHVELQRKGFQHLKRIGIINGPYFGIDSIFNLLDLDDLQNMRFIKCNLSSKDKDDIQRVLFGSPEDLKRSSELPMISGQKERKFN